MTRPEWAGALDDSAVTNGILGAQARTIGTLCEALSNSEREEDPSGAAEPITLMPCSAGLVVWRRDQDWHDHTLLGLICPVDGDLWTFLPATDLPPDVTGLATATWPPNPDETP